MGMEEEEAARSQVTERIGEHAALGEGQFRAEEAAAEGRRTQGAQGQGAGASGAGEEGGTAAAAGGAAGGKRKRGKQPASAAPAGEAGEAGAEAGSAAAGGASGGKRGKSSSTEGRRFQRELRSMMYGFGDDRAPLAASCCLMEELVVDYVYELLHRAQAACEQRQRGVRGGGTSRVKERDLIFALRKDPRRQRRVEELLEVWKEVKAAKSGGLEEMEKDG